uniref:DUF4062 domain-containing protein n=1 Tax=Candidatus Kentrum sp. FW TaxID=2126338 RepID=A0A450TMK9_9GAMM|nr:MAG: hypothetical protein BECKFW1821A_GA0114235_111211 [Candidatus Kentron sp. FW]VFJ68918.1 MAG: hypothetical protein BECKFW1821B_GA0114236_115510 [Candidatus Kentron sp. FW]
MLKYRIFVSSTYEDLEPELGKQVYRSIRKNELLKGLADSPLEPDGNGNSAEEEMA